MNFNYLQGSKEWHTWRSSRIGASDSPVILGVSEYTSPYELWLQKLGKRKNMASNRAIDMGHRYEPLLRSHFELKIGRDFAPVTMVHPKHDFIVASLDGWCAETKECLEIKVAGKEVFGKAKEGFVHDKYLPQLHHQMMVTGAKVNHFFVGLADWSKAAKGILAIEHIIVPEDKEYQEKLMERLLEFRRRIMEKQQPELVKGDVLLAEDQVSMMVFGDLKRAMHKLRKAEKAADAVMDMLLKAQDDYKRAFQTVEQHCEEVLKWPAVEAAGIKLLKKKGVSFVEEVL